MRKRFLACLTAALFILLLAPCGANAAEVPESGPVSDDSRPISFAELISEQKEQQEDLRARLNEGIQTAPSGGVISISSATAKPGSTAKLNVSISGNPGICGFIMGFSYDTSALALKNVELVPNSLKTEAKPFQQSEEGKGNFFFNKNAVWLFGSDSTYNGTWLTLTFDVKSTASDGDKTVSINSSASSFSNKKEEAVSFTMNSGKITVSSETALDITKIIPEDKITVSGKGTGGKAVITVKVNNSAEENKYVCVVGYTTDNGTTYHRMTAAKKSAGVYEYTQTLASNMKFIVMLKGDVDGNKEVKGKDVLKLKRIAVGASTTAREVLAGDVMSSKELASADPAKVKDAVTGKDVLKLKKIVVNDGTLDW